jgi:predicted Zn-dependent protease
MSRIGSGIFFDGFTNVRHAVAVALGTDTVEISAPGGRVLAAWPFSEIAPMTTPEGVLRLGRAKSQDAARLEIRDASLAADLLGRAKRPDRSGLTDSRTRAKVACWGIAAALSLMASAIWGVPFVAERVAPRLPITAEMRLGDAVNAQIRRTLGAGSDGKPFQCGAGPGHEAGRAAFNKLISTLENAADLPVPVRAEVVRSPIVNAIALPGGRVYLFEGLLNQARSPDEIAGVLGHELGHVAHRDGTKNVLEAGSMSLLFGMLLGDFTGGGATAAAAQIVLHSSNSRDKEAAADEFGARLVSKIGGDPKALARMFERLSGSGTQTPHFLLDHPEAKERSAAIEQVAPPAVGKPLLTTQEWAALKRICS